MTIKVQQDIVIMWITINNVHYEWTTLQFHQSGIFEMYEFYSQGIYLSTV